MGELDGEGETEPPVVTCAELGEGFDAMTAAKAVVASKGAMARARAPVFSRRFVDIAVMWSLQLVRRRKRPTLDMAVVMDDNLRL
ncbi:hypothetical protein ASD21_00645 [Caulobacter sp. Root1455]|nr:hypothetical protein ASD38_04695 [Caulobacter sp. Root487D2Y]KQZ06184.1 hypothetical protein ASD21_00645 [Caulobacter sp. Root1455]